MFLFIPPVRFTAYQHVVVDRQTADSLATVGRQTTDNIVWKLVTKEAYEI